MASIEKKPRKGILKSSTSFDKAELTPRSKEMKWDEMNIMATHHPPDKDYGHMKIDEPKTPYSKYSEGEEEEGDAAGADSEPRRGSFGAKTDMDPSSLSEKLAGIEDVEGKRRLRRVSTEDECSSEEEGDLTEEELVHKKQFEQKRKLHYNEFQAVKMAKQLMDEEDDDDDDDDDDVENSKQDSVQMVTDQTDSVDNSGATSNNMGQSDALKSLTETHMDDAGHLETQIN